MRISTLRFRFCYSVKRLSTRHGVDANPPADAQLDPVAEIEEPGLRALGLPAVGSGLWGLRLRGAARCGSDADTGGSATLLRGRRRGEETQTGGKDHPIY
jgi:hypothetical protein